VLAVAPLDWNLGPEFDPRLLELLAILTGTVGAVVSTSPTSASSARPDSCTSSNAPSSSGALPAKTSTAVISWLSTSVAMSSLWPSKRWLALFRPCRISGSPTLQIRSPLASFLIATFSELPSGERLTSRSWSRMVARSWQLASIRCCAGLPALSSLRTSHASRNAQWASATNSVRNRERESSSSQSTSLSPLIELPKWRPRPWLRA